MYRHALSPDTATLNPETSEERASSYFGQSRPEMLALVNPDARTILDVGCARGAFGAALKARSACTVTGIEPFAQAAAHASQRLDRVLNVPVEAVDFQAIGPFDCITFNDVLEHLVDPWAVLRSARAALSPGGTIVASIPNISHYPVISELVLKGRFAYQDSGVLDRTHLRFFTVDSIRELFPSAGLTIQHMEGLGWTELPLWLRVANRLAGGRFASMRHMQYAVVAQPA